MTSSATDVDQVLKTLASQSMKQGSNVRVAVRDLTLKALQQREFTLEQVRKILRSVTEGVNSGVDKREAKVEQALSSTVAGMDDALRKAVQASNVALHKLTGEGYDYEDSNLKQALGELERLEDEFLASIANASQTASDSIRVPWERVLSRTRLSGTGTGTQAAATLRDYAKRAQAAMRAQRETGFKTAHLLTQNFATLASGVLIGMSQGLARSPAVGKKAGAALGRKVAKTAKSAKSAKKTPKTTIRSQARTAKNRVSTSKRAKSAARGRS